MRISTISISKVAYYIIILLLIAAVIFLSLRLIIKKDELAQVFNQQSVDRKNMLQSDKILKDMLKKALPILYIQQTDQDSKQQEDESIRQIGLNLKDPKTLLSFQMPFLVYQQDNDVDVEKINKNQETQTTASMIDEKEGQEQDIYEVDSEGQIIFKNNNNPSDYNNIEQIEGKLPDLKLDGEGPEILIYHTHTTEAYKPSPENEYKETDNFRTTDEMYNVTRVGRELALHLENEYNIDVVHATDVHDYPVYNYSYNRSFETIQKQLKKYKNLKIFFDIHRNAYSTKPSNSEIDCINISGEKVAKIMIVVGSNKAGMEHPNWKKNYSFALLLKDQLNKIYPGLCSKVLVKNYRYNQHISENALLLEIGSTETTLEQAIASTKYLAEAIANIVNQ